MWEIRRKLHSRRQHFRVGLPVLGFHAAFSFSSGGRMRRDCSESACDGLASPRRLQQTSEIFRPGRVERPSWRSFFCPGVLWEVVAKLVAQKLECDMQRSSLLRQDGSHNSDHSVEGDASPFSSSPIFYVTTAAA